MTFKPIRTVIISFILFFCFLSPAAAYEEPYGQGSSSVPLRRFALIVGANDGGKNRIELKYAASDARAFARVMGELGGVKGEDLILLLNPDLKDFTNNLKELKNRVGNVDPEIRKELIIYYSGHSDEEGLLISSDRYSYKKLRDEISRIPTDVRIAILDSCSSGAMTRSKGGVHAPAFLMDEANALEGHAFLTSSSANEASQESDNIGASFFTYYLISGLRGAADSTGDGKVTLTEAYSFAFNETLASTEKSLYGPQHPNFDINLSGTGDLILTDLRYSTSRLIIPEDIQGRIYIRDAGGALIAELNKSPGKEVTLALSDGVYSVLVNVDGELFKTAIQVSGKSQAYLSEDTLSSLKGFSAYTRGEGNEPAVPASVYESFHFSLLPELPSDGLWGATANRDVSLNLLLGYSANINGFEISLIGNIVSERVSGFQGAGIGNIVGKNVRGFQLAGFINYVGGDASFIQGAGAVNFDLGNFSGFQGAAAFNYTGGSFSGFQGAGGVNLIRDSLKGIQGAGAVNIAFGGFLGAQIAGVVNIAGYDAVGAQVTGIFNFAERSIAGTQLAGIANFAGHIAGVQLSLVNISNSVDGVQIGLVNIARNVRGTQVGLVNISDSIKGIPVGLLNFEKEGQQHLDVWRTNDNSYHLAFRLGSRLLYTMITGSYQPGEESSLSVWSYGVGMGGSIPIHSFFINLDIILSSMQEGFEKWYITENLNLLPEIRILGGIQSSRNLGIFAGLSYLMYVPGWYADPEANPEGSDSFHMKPRIFIGIQL